MAIIEARSAEVVAKWTSFFGEAHYFCCDFIPSHHPAKNCARPALQYTQKARETEQHSVILQKIPAGKRGFFHAGVFSDDTAHRR